MKLFHHLYDNFTIAAAKLLPDTVIMSSCSDQTVPWYSSTHFSQLLLKVGVSCRNLMYNKESHCDFVVDYALKAFPEQGTAQWLRDQFARHKAWSWVSLWSEDTDAVEGLEGMCHPG